jgi:hypothetical protein
LTETTSACMPDNSLEHHELLRAFNDLAITADGVLGREKVPKAAHFDEDFRVFRELVTAGMAFMKHPEHRYRGSYAKEAAESHCAFQAMAKSWLRSMQDRFKYPYFSLILDHDAHVPKAMLYNFDPCGYCPFWDDAFEDMATAFIAGLEYSNEYDLCSEEWYEFRRLEKAVRGFCEHSKELRWLPLNWNSMDLSYMQDLPKAAIYLHFYRLEIPRKLIGTYLEFRELAEVAMSSMSYDVPPYFPKYLQLPAEIREESTHEYLLLEREAGRLSKHVHYDRFGSRCCVWEYPDVLIACDNQDSATFPPPETARAPCGWLPTLAFASKSMLGEVVEIMLRKTVRIDLKYYEHVTSFKIATWLRKFIAAIPYNDGTRAVKYLCFPHMHRYNSIQPLALTNPSFELMAACFNLRKVDMTFYHEMLRVEHPPNSGVLHPRTAMELATFYQV